MHHKGRFSSTVVTPVCDGSDGDSALEEVVIVISAKSRRGYKTAVTPTHDPHFQRVDVVKVLLEVPARNITL